MKSKKLTMIAFLMFLAAGSQKLQASSEFTFDKHGIGIDKIGNRYHQNLDDSGIIKMVTGTMRKFDSSGNALDYNDFDNEELAGWKKLKVVDIQGKLVGRYQVDPQGAISYPTVFTTDPVRPIEDLQLRKRLTELVAKLEAIEVPAHL